MKKKSKLQLIQEKTQLAINNTNKNIEILGKNTNELYISLNSIQEHFDKIRNIPSDKMLEYEKIKKIRLEWKQQAQKIEEDYKNNVIKDASAGVLGTGVGITVVTMGPTIAMGVATTFGVASTGTAISTLSGAAATNAALAWLGGGALATGGGGMVAGETFLTLAGPAGWAIAGITLATSGLLFWKNKRNQNHIENIFSIIGERDIKSYELAIVELNERTSRIIDENGKLNDAIERIKEFGTDYNKMHESQQYEIGAYVNLMLASTQLLVNPIKGLSPKYNEEDFARFSENKDDIIKNNKNLIISLANFLYKIELAENDKALLHKKLRKNKEMLKSLNVTKKDFSIDLFNKIFDALEEKYNSEEK